MTKPQEEPQSELLKRMSRVVGHEVRNPLAVIKNSAYYVRAKLTSAGAVDPKIEKHLSIIESEIARADKIIADIVAYTRPAELKPEPCEVNSVVDGALGAFACPAGVTVAKKLASHSPKAALDKAAIQAAVAVLLANAAEAMDAGGTVTVSTKASDGHAVIEVKDTGTGFKPEDKDKLCLPFFTTKPRGLGLGLAGASRAVHAHHGKLEAECSASGAVFRITLPSA